MPSCSPIRARRSAAAFSCRRAAAPRFSLGATRLIEPAARAAEGPQLFEAVAFTASHELVDVPARRPRFRAGQRLRLGLQPEDEIALPGQCPAKRFMLR